MDKLTEEQWEKIIKKEGCAFKELYKVRGEYANTPMYLRVYISLLAKQEVFDDMNKILHPYKNKPEPKGYPLDSYSHKEYEDLKQRHLSTLQKAKELNSDYEATPKVCPTDRICSFTKNCKDKVHDCPHVETSNHCEGHCWRGTSEGHCWHGTM